MADYRDRSLTWTEPIWTKPPKRKWVVHIEVIDGNYSCWSAARFAGATSGKTGKCPYESNILSNRGEAEGVIRDYAHSGARNKAFAVGFASPTGETCWLMGWGNYEMP